VAAYTYLASAFVGMAITRFRRKPAADKTADSRQSTVDG
jgi:hypothetical protein